MSTWSVSTFDHWSCFDPDAHRFVHTVGDGSTTVPIVVNTKDELISEEVYKRDLAEHQNALKMHRNGVIQDFIDSKTALFIYDGTGLTCLAPCLCT